MGRGTGTGKIPRYLDAPITILVWDADVFMPAAMLFILGIFTHNFFLFTAFAGTYLYAIAHFQQHLPRGMVGNILHHYGLYPYAGYPTTKGLELELKNGGHDLFISVGASVPAEFTHFPVDMHFICDGAVYQVNAVVDSKYTTTNLELVQMGGLRVGNLRAYEDAVQRASALPYEEQIAKIMMRVWNNTPLPYWRVRSQNKSCSGSPCTLRLSVETGINGLTAWDFLAPRELDVPELLSKLGGSVAGDIVSIGRVSLKQAQRVIILTREKAGRR